MSDEDCYLLQCYTITRIIIKKDCYLTGFVGNLSAEESTECTQKYSKYLKYQVVT